MKGTKDYTDSRMCKLAKKDVPAEDPTEYAALIKDAAYFCTKCGRTAVQKKMLCKPAKIGSVAAPPAEEPESEKQKKVNKKKKKKKK